MNRGMVEHYKNAYPAGTRIQLDFMADDPHPIPSGTKGSVVFVDDMGTLHCKFDNGRSLGMCPEVDSFHKIQEQTENEDIAQTDEEIGMGDISMQVSGMLQFVLGLMLGGCFGMVVTVLLLTSKDD